MRLEGDRHRWNQLSVKDRISWEGIVQKKQKNEEPRSSWLVSLLQIDTQAPWACERAAEWDRLSLQDWMNRNMWTRCVRHFGVKCSMEQARAEGRERVRGASGEGR